MLLFGRERHGCVVGQAGRRRFVCVHVARRGRGGWLVKD
jgi:hypothetical protein